MSEFWSLLDLPSQHPAAAHRAQHTRSFQNCSATEWNQLQGTRGKKPSSPSDWQVCLQALIGQEVLNSLSTSLGVSVRKEEGIVFPAQASSPRPDHFQICEVPHFGSTCACPPIAFPPSLWGHHSRSRCSSPLWAVNLLSPCRDCRVCLSSPHRTKQHHTQHGITQRLLRGRAGLAVWYPEEPSSSDEVRLETLIGQ